MPKKTTQTKGNVKDMAVRAALALAADRGWSAVTLDEVAAKAGLSLADLHDHFEDRLDILAAYARIVDRRMLDNASSSGSPRDRLFDLIMERFDALNEDREGVVAILRDMKFDPKQMIVSLPHLGRSMAWTLEAAGVSTAGWRGAARIAGLTALYLKTLRHWMDDESEDMSATMAALDKNLERAERWAQHIP